MAPELRELVRQLSGVGSWTNTQLETIHDRNVMNETPLHTFCFWGDLPAVKKLLTAGADINAKGENGNTPLTYAVMSISLDVITYLLNAGADCNLTNDWGDKPVDWAISLAAATSHKCDRLVLTEIEKILRSARKADRKK